jgi:CspA family cold shock protein
MPTGTVKNFDAKKGWGFLSNDEGDADVFVHHTCINMDGFRALKAGQRVQYEIEVGGPKSKQQATQVTVIGEVA